MSLDLHYEYKLGGGRKLLNSRDLDAKEIDALSLSKVILSVNRLNEGNSWKHHLWIHNLRITPDSLKNINVEIKNIDELENNFQFELYPCSEINIDYEFDELL